jgi:thermostable 8-oxoguanine DNA glycosylase
MSVLGQLAKVAKAKPLRSTLDEAVEALARPKGTGAEYLKELEKTKGVKPTEIKERGIDKVLANMPKVNKEEIVKAIQSKANPAIEEKILGGVLSPELQVTRDALHNKYKELVDNIADAKVQFEEGKISYIVSNRRIKKNKIQTEALDSQINEINKTIGNTKYGQYTIPNGENYREMLLRLPEREGNNFTSSHFDEPNILAHMRVSDRAGPNGEKVLHLEELQSDWHQKGRQHGYQEQTKPIVKTESNPFGFNRIYDKEVPDAPFKKNWHEVALKKLINYATENGYDKLAITSGEEQAKRFNLSKHIDSIMLAPNPYENKNVYPYYFKAFDKQGNRVADDIVNEDKLTEFIGKEQAKQLLSSPVNPMGERMISGANIVTGGEGMKGFYDKILPEYLNKLGKPHGAEVQLHGMPLENKQWELNGQMPVLKNSPVNLHTFDLTPSLKNEVTQKGLPLYQQIGIPLGGAEAVRESQPEPEMKRGGKVSISNNPDTMFMELADRKLAKGGAVQSLETNLSALPKTDYHSIDKLMAHISKEFNIHPKKLHDDFVAKHHMTPDTWIKRK